MFMGAQVIDPHTHQYMDRLRDEPVFLALAQKVAEYLERREEYQVVISAAHEGTTASVQHSKQQGRHAGASQAGAEACGALLLQDGHCV